MDFQPVDYPIFGQVRNWWNRERGFQSQLPPLPQAQYGTVAGMSDRIAGMSWDGSRRIGFNKNLRLPSDFERIGRTGEVDEDQWFSLKTLLHENAHQASPTSRNLTRYLDPARWIVDKPSPYEEGLAETVAADLMPRALRDMGASGVPDVWYPSSYPEKSDLIRNLSWHAARISRKQRGLQTELNPALADSPTAADWRAQMLGSPEPARRQMADLVKAYLMFMEGKKSIAAPSRRYGDPQGPTKRVAHSLAEASNALRPSALSGKRLTGAAPKRRQVRRRPTPRPAPRPTVTSPRTYNPQRDPIRAGRPRTRSIASGTKSLSSGFANIANLFG